MRVKIPFLEHFKESMLNGTKTMTTRSKRYGWKGDTFDAFGATFQIEKVYKAALSWIAKYCWQAEGCSSEQDFIDVWKSIHHKRNDPRSLWHVHEFRLLEVS
jgi:hypothetical protein